MKVNHLFIEPLEARIAPAALATVNLSTLNGSNGFKIQGGSDTFGTSVSPAGDVNGDGISDLIIGAPGASTYDAGVAAVIFGKAGGVGPAFDLASLNGSNGFLIIGRSGSDGGEHNGDRFNGDNAGSSVSTAGDINGDGFNDLLIGTGKSNTTYVVFGKAAAFSPTLHVSSLDGANGFTLWGELADSNISVSAAGDINGDNFADLLIGADGGFGAAYVVYGKPGGFSPALSLSSLNGTNGTKIQGEAVEDYSGRSVSGAGDINGDGLADLLIGAYGADPHGSMSGAAYVVFGKTGGLGTLVKLSTLNGSNGFKILGEAAGDSAGISVSGVGDLNGDSFADLLVGASGASPNGVGSGAAYLIFGKAIYSGTPLDLSSLDGTNGFKILGETVDASSETNGEGFLSVSGPGDVNGDGLADLLIGAREVSRLGLSSAAGYVIFGKTGGFNKTLNLSGLTGADGFKVNGGAESFASSYLSDHWVSGAGDLNGDGLADLLVGAPFVQRESSVIFGFKSSAAAELPIAFSKNHQSATFFDGDGDLVTVKVSRGALTMTDFTLNPDGSLKTLNLRDPDFAEADLTISATKVKHGTGNGLAEVGTIEASGIDLGKVVVDGRLGRIFAGDSAVKTIGVKALTVDSLGQGAEFGAAANYHSKIVGALGALTVKNDARAMELEVAGGVFAGIGKITIGGSLDAGGRSSGNAGFVHASGNIGPVKIGGDVIGGADFSGISAEGKLGQVSIGGALKSLDEAKPVTLSAQGQLDAHKTGDAVAIAGVSVKSDVNNARILAGFTNILIPLNPNAGIGAITVGGNWAASSVAAGVQDTTGKFAAPDGFGRSDTVIPGDTSPTLFSRIATIVIKGSATGSATVNTFYGVTAEKLGRVSIHGAQLVLATADTTLDPNFHAVRFS